MKQVHLTLPEIGLIAGTRGMLGAGIALLLGSRLDESRRKQVGWGLVAAGALSTVPLIVMAIRTMNSSDVTSSGRGRDEGADGTRWAPNRFEEPPRSEQPMELEIPTRRRFSH